MALNRTLEKNHETKLSQETTTRNQKPRRKDRNQTPSPKFQKPIKHSDHKSH